jgi:uncharacterized membrane protein (DUF485 family)
MAREKEKPSILGLGHGASSDPNAWRPSKARARDSGFSLGLTETQQPSEHSSRSCIPTENRERLSSWRPSKANEERLSSLSPLRRRRRFALPPGARLLLTFVFFICCAYFFLKLWLMPEAGQLHPALAIAAVVLTLLFASAVIGVIVRRRRKHSDEKSTLRL